MASFGLRIEDKAWVKFGPEADDTGQDESPSFVIAEDESRQGTPFQKRLAWASYYVMVFTALCAFQPAKVAYAAGVAGSLVGVEIPPGSQSRPARAPAPYEEGETRFELIAINEWQLRGAITFDDGFNVEGRKRGI